MRGLTLLLLAFAMISPAQADEPAGEHQPLTEPPTFVVVPTQPSTIRLPLTVREGGGDDGSRFWLRLEQRGTNDRFGAAAVDRYAAARRRRPRRAKRARAAAVLGLF